MDSTDKSKKESGAQNGQVVVAPYGRSEFVWAAQAVDRIQLCCFLSAFPGAAAQVSMCFSLLLSKMEHTPM